MDAPIDFAAKRAKRAESTHKDAWHRLGQETPHLSLQVWYDDEKSILVRELIARRDVPSDTGQDLLNVYYKLVDAAGQLAADMAESSPAEDSWKVEPIMQITWTRDGYNMTCYEDFLDDCRGDRWRSFRFMLGRTWRTVYFMLRKSFSVLRAPSEPTKPS
jgi:hypothetical protein